MELLELLASMVAGLAALVVIVVIYQWRGRATAPEVFDRRMITFWQSLRLLVLASLLFGGAGAIEIGQSGPALAADGKAADRIGPVTFLCDDSSRIIATFDNTPDPATVRLVRGDQTFTLPQAISGSGARYLGDDIEFWNKGDDAMVEWQGRKLECSTGE